MAGLVAVSLDGVDGLLVISWTVSKDGPGPLTPLVTTRGLLRSTFAWSSDAGRDAGREALLWEVFGGVDSRSVRRFPAHDGILDFSGLRTFAGGSGTGGGERKDVLLGSAWARWAEDDDENEGKGKADGTPFVDRDGLLLS